MRALTIVTFSKGSLCRVVVGSQADGKVGVFQPEETNGLHGQGKGARRAGSEEARRGTAELQSGPAAEGRGQDRGARGGGTARGGGPAALCRARRGAGQAGRWRRHQS